MILLARRVWRYQRGNPNPDIEEEQTTRWPKEKVQKDKQRSTIHTHKTKDRVTRTSLETGDELRCSSSDCYWWLAYIRMTNKTWKKHPPLELQWARTVWHYGYPFIKRISLKWFCKISKSFFSVFSYFIENISLFLLSNTIQLSPK